MTVFFYTIFTPVEPFGNTPLWEITSRNVSTVRDSPGNPIVLYPHQCRAQFRTYFTDQETGNTVLPKIKSWNKDPFMTGSNLP